MNNYMRHFALQMNQDQYHASLLNKHQPAGLGWDGITKASSPKVYPPEKPNTTDVEDTIKRVKDNDHKLTDLNWNNIKVSLSCCISCTEILSYKLRLNGV
jgi:tropomodulin